MLGIVTNYCMQVLSFGSIGVDVPFLPDSEVRPCNTVCPSISTALSELPCMYATLSEQQHGTLGHVAFLLPMFIASLILAQIPRTAMEQIDQVSEEAAAQSMATAKHMPGSGERQNVMHLDM